MLAFVWKTPIHAPPLACAKISSMRIIGVDPGARETGIIVRDDTTLLGACVVTRSKEQPLAGYLRDVLDAITDYTGELIVVEDVNTPTFHATDRVIHLYGLLHTAMVIGAILAQFPTAQVVSPDGYGSHPLAYYPTELIGNRELRGTGMLRHTRSAWDISYALGSDHLLTVR